MKGSIQLKLIGLLFLMSVNVVIIGLLSVFSLRFVTESSHQLTVDYIPIGEVTQQTLLALEEANGNLTSALLSRTVEDIRLVEADFNRSIFKFGMFVNALTLGSASQSFQQLDAGLVYSEWKRTGFEEKYRVPNPNSEEVKQIAQEISTAVNAYTSESQELMTLQKKLLRRSSETNKDEIEELGTQKDTLTTSIKDHKESIIRLTQQILTENGKLQTAAIEKQAGLADTINKIILGLIVINFFVGFGLGIFYIKNTVLKPIRSLTQVVNDISTGKLDTKIPQELLESKDEMGELARAFDRTVVSLKLAMKEQTDHQSIPPSSADSGGK